MDERGAVLGFGWDDIWVLATGLQVRPVPRVAVRGGYNFTENPVPDRYAAYNVAAPAVVQHHLTVGFGVSAGDLQVDLGYYHAFANSIAGDMATPMGPMAVTNEMEEDSFLLTFSFQPGS